MARFLSKSWPIDLAASARKLELFPRNSSASGPTLDNRYDLRRAQTIYKWDAHAALD